eukprot:3280708-Prymnesium_polylepis.1
MTSKQSASELQRNMLERMSMLDGTATLPTDFAEQLAQDKRLSADATTWLEDTVQPGAYRGRRASFRGRLGIATSSPASQRGA